MTVLSALVPIRLRHAACLSSIAAKNFSRSVSMQSLRVGHRANERIARLSQRELGIFRFSVWKNGWNVPGAGIRCPPRRIRIFGALQWRAVSGIPLLDVSFEAGGREVVRVSGHRSAAM
jgi:hypothetical protein